MPIMISNHSGNGSVQDVDNQMIDVTVDIVQTPVENQTVVFDWPNVPSTTGNSDARNGGRYPQVPLGTTLVMADGTTYPAGTPVSLDHFVARSPMTEAHIAEIFGINGVNLTVSGTRPHGLGNYGPTSPDATTGIVYDNVIPGSSNGNRHSLRWDSRGALIGRDHLEIVTGGNRQWTISSSSVSMVTTQAPGLQLTITNNASRQRVITMGTWGEITIPSFGSVSVMRADANDDSWGFSVQELLPVGVELHSGTGETLNIANLGLNVLANRVASNYALAYFGTSATEFFSIAAGLNYEITTLHQDLRNNRIGMFRKRDGSFVQSNCVPSGNNCGDGQRHNGWGTTTPSAELLLEWTHSAGSGNKTVIYNYNTGTTFPNPHQSGENISLVYGGYGIEYDNGVILFVATSSTRSTDFNFSNQGATRTGFMFSTHAGSISACAATTVGGETANTATALTLVNSIALPISVPAGTWGENIILQTGQSVTITRQNSFDESWAFTVNTDVCAINPDFVRDLTVTQSTFVFLANTGGEEIIEVTLPEGVTGGRFHFQPSTTTGISVNYVTYNPVNNTALISLHTVSSPSTFDRLLFHFPLVNQPLDEALTRAVITFKGAS